MDPETTTSIYQALIQAGVLGPILIAAGWWIVKLHRELRQVSEARTTDAQGVTDRVLALQATQHELSQQIATTQATMGSALGAIAGRLERLEDGQGRIENALGSARPGGPT